ncbi:uncharacterized protein V6R79_014207 [Siganus canaliculatus]
MAAAAQDGSQEDVKMEVVGGAVAEDVTVRNQTGAAALHVELIRLWNFQQEPSLVWSTASSSVVRGREPSGLMFYRSTTATRRCSANSDHVSRSIKGFMGCRDEADAFTQHTDAAGKVIFRTTFWDSCQFN